MGQIDQQIKALSSSGYLKGTVIFARELMESARLRHQLHSNVESQALGEMLLGGLLLASTMREGERVSLSIKGGSFLKYGIADALPAGTVRGFIVTNPDFEQERFDSQLGPWQTGLLSVTRQKQNHPEPYIGTVGLQTGYLAKDLAFYLTQSEQIPSALAIQVEAERDGKIKHAVGFLIQALPGIEENELQSIETELKRLRSLSAFVHQVSTPKEILATLWCHTGFAVLDEREVHFACPCSKEKIDAALKLLPDQDLQEMIEKDHGAKVSCEFCGNVFVFNEKHLQAIRT